MAFPLNELQKKLGYNFENLQLLHEALTHDFYLRNNYWDICGDGSVFYRKRKLHRLKCVGVSVLKLLIAEKAVVHQDNIGDPRFSVEGFLTETCKHIYEKCRLTWVANYLQLSDYIYSETPDNSKNPAVIKQVIHAIFGAIFIDGGGCDSKNNCALQSVRKLLDFILMPVFLNGIPNSQDLHKCFKPYQFDIQNYSLSNKPSVIIKSYKNLEEKIDYKFSRPDLIKTALTHDSVKNFVPDISHYEVLEFLGDAVYELVICEYLFWYYINDREGNLFNFETLKKFVAKTFQQIIANGLNLQQFIIKPEHVTVTDVHDFLESILGAIYVDAKSLEPVKRVLVKLCQQFEVQTLDNCNIRLPFALRTYYGSSHHVPVGNMGLIKEFTRRPPEKQDTFKILNFDKLRSTLGKYYDFVKIPESIQSYNSSVKIVGSKSWCNQQEFGRISLYETMIRYWYLDNKEYLWDTGKLLLKYHTYNTGHRDDPEETMESMTSSYHYVAESLQQNEVKGTGSNFRNMIDFLGPGIFDWVEDFVTYLKIMGYKFIVGITIKMFMFGLYVNLFTFLDSPLNILLVIITVCIGLYYKYFSRPENDPDFLIN